MLCEPSVNDVLDRLRTRTRDRRCPECGRRVTISGFDGEYGWICRACDAVGLGYTSRSATRRALRRER